MLGTFVLVLRILLVVALYAFLLVALFAIWRTLVVESRQLVGRPIPSIVLEGVDGKSEKQQFRKKEIWLGRSSRCDLHVMDKSASAQHAKIVYSEKQWWLTDQDSTNGTFLNNEKIHQPVVIISGDSVRIGNLEWFVTIESD